jgi:hypothetical protein
MAIVPPTEQKTFWKRAVLASGPWTKRNNKSLTIFGERCARKSSSVQIHAERLAKFWGSSLERIKSQKEIADAQNVSQDAVDLPWPICYSRNKEVSDRFIVYLLVFLGWDAVIVQTLSPLSKRHTFYAIFGDGDVFLPHKLRRVKPAENVTWSQAAGQFAKLAGQRNFPKDKSGNIAWTSVPTLHGDVNWDEVGFYKWDPSQRKLSCGDEDLHVTLASAHIGQDPSRVHLMNNVSYDAATLGVPGLRQIQCKELFSNLCGVAATRLAFMELMQLMDAKFPKVAKSCSSWMRSSCSSCGHLQAAQAQAARGQPLSLSFLCSEHLPPAAQH